jgi:hypothetical protein
MYRATRTMFAALRGSEAPRGAMEPSPAEAMEPASEPGVRAGRASEPGGRVYCRSRRRRHERKGVTLWHGFEGGFAVWTM